MLLFGRDQPIVMGPAPEPLVRSPATADATLASPFPVGVVAPWAPLSAISVDPWMILRLCRYRQREAVPASIWEAARAMAAHASTLVEPRALVRPLRVAMVGADGARLGEGPVFTGRAIARLLAGCPLAAPFALTLGPSLGAEVVALTERGDLLEGFLLDTAGWAAIETAVRALRLDLAARARPAGWRLTHRLGPGHQDWPLEEQRGFVGLFDGAENPVHLSEHGVLVPFKSITGCFGLAPQGAAEAGSSS